MNDIDIRISGRAGRITLTRPQALNAMTYEMCMGIDAAMRLWRDDDNVDLVVIDAQGDKAFCSGGDIAELYATGMRGEYAYGRTFWRDEYRLNAFIFEYPKPVITFMQGFTMGGGVGIGCHGTHRVVDDTSRIAMPECGIGLVPDVGGSFLLALAPGRMGEYLALSAARMHADDAIYTGFADHYIPRERWPALIGMLESSGDATHVASHATAPPQGGLRQLSDHVNRHFAGESLTDILNSLRAEDSDLARATLKAMGRNAPLSMACSTEIIHRLRGTLLNMRRALELEYRFTFRAMEMGDFLEGIRAQIIDKDRNPSWQFADQNVPTTATARMLMPLGADMLTFEQGETP